MDSARTGYETYVYCETCQMFFASPPVVPRMHEEAYGHKIEEARNSNTT
jgi:hypothetical protein